MVIIPYQEKNEPSRFSSAYQFVEVVDRIFGDCVERLLLNFSVDEHCTYEDIYWPHVGATRSLHKAWVSSAMTQSRLLTIPAKTEHR
jgi:hypothetical protein